MTLTTTTKPVTESQTRYLNDLIAKITNPAVQDALRADLRTLYTARLLDTREASRQIDRVKAILTAQALAPVAPAPVVTVEAATTALRTFQQPYPVVAAGRYAVIVDGAVRFYNVTKDNGRTYVKRYVSDALTRISGGEAVKVLRMIEADPKAAALRFARDKMRCYVCGRSLTDTTEGGSRSKGIGPDCEAKGLGF